MSKNATTEYPVTDAVAQRWSPRSFSDKMVEPALLGSIFEAARWAPSAFNEQPWRFIVATKANPQAYARLLSCLNEFNQSWAESAPVLAITVVSEQFSRNGKPNNYARHDLGLACGQLALQAASMGIYSHFMAGIEPKKAVETYQIPQGFTPFTGLALGYLGDGSNLDADKAAQEQAERQRNPLHQQIFFEQWQQPFFTV